jgi:hypothetical protein
LLAHFNRQAAVVEVKCPTPYYPVNGKPWAFGVRGSSGYRPYKCMKAHYYCQAQLNMLVTGARGFEVRLCEHAPCHVGGGWQANCLL